MIRGYILIISSGEMHLDQQHFVKKTKWWYRFLIRYFSTTTLRTCITSHVKQHSDAPEKCKVLDRCVLAEKKSVIVSVHHATPCFLASLIGIWESYWVGVEVCYRCRGGRDFVSRNINVFWDRPGVCISHHFCMWAVQHIISEPLLSSAPFWADHYVSLRSWG